MVVKTPAFIRDEDGHSVPIAKIWPNAPDELRVDRWDSEGESELRALRGQDHLDANQLDYPSTFEVVRDTSSHRAAIASETRAGLRRAVGRERHPLHERGGSTRAPLPKMVRGRLV